MSITEEEQGGGRDWREWLAEFLEAREVTQTRLAELSGLSVPTVNMFVRRHRGHSLALPVAHRLFAAVHSIDRRLKFADIFGPDGAPREVRRKTSAA